METNEFRKLLEYKKNLKKNKSYLIDEFVEVSRVENDSQLFAVLFYILSSSSDTTTQVLHAFFNKECCFKNLSTDYRTTSLQYKTFCRKVDELVQKQVFHRERFGNITVITLHPDLYEKAVTALEGK